MRKIGLGIGLACLLLLQGCDFFSKKSKEIIVAECYDNYLYESDLRMVAQGADPYDSIARVNAYIDSWVRQRLLLHQAEANLTPEELDFTKQIEEYRNSLVVYAYETQLIGQKLDTVISDDEINAYYEQNKDSFVLHNTLVKVAYVVFDEDCKQTNDFRKLMADRDTLMLQKLDALATEYAVSSYLDVDHWMRLDELTKVVPIEIFNVESFLKKNKFVSFDKDGLTYMARFEDFLLEESISPIEMERDNIKALILMRRKKDLIDRMHASLYEDAQKEHAFEVYVGAPAAKTIDSI